MLRLLKWLTLAVVGIAVLLVVAIGLSPQARQFMLHDFPFMGETFTPEKWAAATSCEGLTGNECMSKESDCARGPMVRSLLRDHLTAGAKREAVIALLGPEEFTDKDGAGCLHWNLGMCSGLGLDYDSLFVCFDGAGHLIKAGHMQH